MDMAMFAVAVLRAKDAYNAQMSKWNQIRPSRLSILQAINKMTARKRILQGIRG